MAETILADAIRNVSLSNGVVRIELDRSAGQGETTHEGTLCIPANQVANFANALNNALRELQERLEQQRTQSEETAAAGD